MHEPRLFTLPPGVPFLPALADALMGGRLIPGFPDAGDPLALADALIYLPTRRAARAFAALLAERAGEGAVLLPRIVALGEADAAEADMGAEALEAEGLLPAVAPLERRLVLTHLVQLWARQLDRAMLRQTDDEPFLVPGTPADSVKLAADLEGLMDALATEGLGWERLAEAVADEFSRYFAITLDFARIASAYWPDELAARAAMDPTLRRIRVIERQAARLAAERPDRPIVIAGSTGSIPATAALIDAVARLPRGVVVLPGLDQDLDAAGWDAIGASTDPDCVHGHPQAMLRRLVEEHLRVGRDAVRPLASPDAMLAARAALLSQALRPAETTDAWAAMEPAAREALAARGCEGLSLIEAADEREEALAIAVALRETLSVPGRTAALVTPDRALAARVAAELGRWGVEVDDSAGQPLGNAIAGRLARLAAEAAASAFEAGRVLALLAHPAARLGLTRRAVERAASALEIGVLRGPKPGPGLAGLRAALDLRRGEAGKSGAPLPRRRLREEDWAAAADLLARLEEAFAGFTLDEHPGEAIDLRGLCAAHRRAVEHLARDPDGAPASFADGSWEMLSALFDDLEACESGAIEGRFADYPAFFAVLAAERAVTAPVRAVHRRLKILGLLEARLLAADRIVLGGLDEGVWPPRADSDAFLNRPMRHAVGLAAPERRIGQTAHDLVQALGTRDAVMTRAIKRDGSPTVPSRFLQRLKAFVGPEAWARVTRGGRRYLAFAAHLDQAPREPALPRPAPCPDKSLFPEAFSVTEIETLVRDPYAIYARKILRLDALEAVAEPPGAAERGTLIHDILARFSGEHPDALPADALERLIGMGDEAFAPLRRAFPEIHAEWWPRFERLAAAYCAWERARRPDIAGLHLERSGSLAIPLPDGRIVTLRARADRIEERRDGGLVVVDFKTGAPPGNKEICVGFSPQMTLQGAMLRHGAFAGVPAAAETPGLLYVQVSGGRKALEQRQVEAPRGETLAGVIDAHESRLRRLLAHYASGERGYTSRPYPKYAKRVSPYDHLARVKEWSAAGGTDGEGA